LEAADIGTVGGVTKLVADEPSSNPPPILAVEAAGVEPGGVDKDRLITEEPLPVV
jgi:hypothetical protein